MENHFLEMDANVGKASTTKKEKRDRRRARNKAKAKQAKLIANMAEEGERERILKENRDLKCQVEKLTFQLNMAAIKGKCSRPNISFATSSIKASFMSKEDVLHLSKKETAHSMRKSLTAIDSIVRSVPVSLNPAKFSLFHDTDIKGTYGSIQIIQSLENGVKLVKKSLNPLLTSELAARCEAKILTLVSGHPGFPVFHGTLGTLGLVMEDLGESLNGQYLSKTIHNHMKNLTHEQCIIVARQVCEGFIHLHDINILHNDIKSNNLVLQLLASPPFIRVVIIDFGKSRLKSSPEVYHLSAEKVEFYNKHHRYLAHELRNCIDTAQSEETDCYSIGYMFKHIGIAQKFHFIFQLGQKMKMLIPKERLCIPSALVQLKAFRLECCASK